MNSWSIYGADGEDKNQMRKVFGIGLPRTGTTSLTHALTILGYRTIHSPHDRISRREISEYLRGNADEIQLTVLQSHDALSDIEVCAIYQGLDRAYPGSRFILTVREKSAWLDSIERVWKQLFVPVPIDQLKSDEKEYSEFFPFVLRRLLERTRRRRVPIESLGAEETIAYYDRHVLSELYDAYHDEVRSYFRDRPEQLLTLEITGGEGWEKLAPFLDAQVPREPFPFEMKLTRRESNERETSLSADPPAYARSVEVVRAYLDAFRNKDLASCQRFFAEGAIVKQLEKRYCGPSAISKWHQERFKNGVSVLEVADIRPIGDLVVVDLTITSKLIRRWRVKLSGQAVIRLSNEKIQEVGFEGIQVVR